MINFDYDGVMKRYDVRVPQTIAGESSMLTVAHISENDKLTLLRELRIEFVRQILMWWDEEKHMLKMKEERETGEFDKYFDDDNNKPKFH